MGSPFLYRLRINWTKNGKHDQDVIPVYSMKAGASESLWPGTLDRLDPIKLIADGADGARMLTICSDVIYAYRSLESRSIDYFELHIKDTRIKTAPTEERKTVATITCKDMNGGAKFSVNREVIKMSCEPLSNQLCGVTLDFHDYQGGPVFAVG
jgi:hypothetical protein